MNNYEWLEKLPPEFVELVQQLLPLPMALAKCIEECRRLEGEVLILGNVLLKKGYITPGELETMATLIIEQKKQELNQKQNVTQQILSRKDFLEINREIGKIVNGKRNQNVD